MKVKRHQKILELIASNVVQTQEDLLQLLRGCGYQVTQATVSRDIKELRLQKVLTSDGYKYTQAAVNPPVRMRLEMLFKESVREIDFAGNIVVVKCHTGMANAACQALDDVGMSNIVGTLAGDDTFFVLTKDAQTASEIAQELRTIGIETKGG